MQTALSGLHAATASLQVAANNFANQQTPGFKASRILLADQGPATLAYSAAGAAQLIQVGRGVSVAGIDVNFAPGATQPGDDPTALLSLQGEGLFILEGERGERLYTRDGHFRLNANGELVTSQGRRVLGYAADPRGEIDTSELVELRIVIGSQAPAEGGQSAELQNYSIDPRGRIVGRYSDGSRRPLGQLRLARFPNPSGLTQRGGNAYAATPASGLPIESNPGEGGAATVLNGTTELSNVDLGRELIELTLAGTQFRANLTVFRTADALLGELFFPWRR
ncbi:MAG TPA: flagellar hook basal-body protein [Pirellulaceae bacterium]|nr:flagellar hook basal-body protein [Pirellulaceae bacterium]